MLKPVTVFIADTQASLPSTADQGQLASVQDTGITLQYNGNAWTPSSKVQVKKTTAAVNAKNTGQTLLYTLEQTPLNFYPILIVPRATGAGISSVTTQPAMSIGSNATSYNNIATTSLLGSIMAALGTGSSQPTNASYSPSLPAGTGIYCNVTTGAVATNYTVLFDIIGFYDT